MNIGAGGGTPPVALVNPAGANSDQPFGGAFLALQGGDGADGWPAKLEIIGPSAYAAAGNVDFAILSQISGHICRYVAVGEDSRVPGAAGDAPFKIYGPLAGFISHDGTVSIDGTQLVADTSIGGLGPGNVEASYNPADTRTTLWPNQWFVGVTNLDAAFPILGFVNDNTVGAGAAIALGSAAGAIKGVLSFGTGAPVAGAGTNGDIYIRFDGGAGTTIYQKRAGTWVGIL